MEFDEFMSITQLEDLKRINVKIEEVKKLYDISEAEFQLIQQMSFLIKVGMNLSGPLQIKLVRAYAAMAELIGDEVSAIKARSK